MHDSQRQQDNAQRALQSYAAMQRWFYLRGRDKLYRETADPAAPAAYLWPFSRAVQGTVTLAGLPARLTDRGYAADVPERLRGLSRFFDGRARVPAYDSAIRPWFGRGGDKYHDDNVWVALTLVQAYRMGLLSTLEIPRALFAFGRSGWDSRGDAPCPGGVFWVEQGVGLGLSNHDRGTGTSAGNAMLGWQLAELDQSDPEPSELAARMLGWVEQHLDSSGVGRGPFWNAITGHGNVDQNLWSYCQGVVVGARVLQYRKSNDAAVLSRAEALADQTLATFGAFVNHPPSFNAMCLQNLLMLCSVSADRDLHERVVEAFGAYADWTWDPHTGARDPATDLFSFDDSGAPAPGHQAKLQDQGALVQLYGLLALDPAEYTRLA